jgi:branched-chain amino acid transport system substrate-binding protein
MISGSNTSPSLTAIGDQPGRDWRPGYFRTAHNDAEQGKAAAQFAYQFLQDPKAATIDDGDSYTKGLARAFQGAFTKLGGEIVLITGVNKGDTNMRPVLDAVVSSEAKLVFIPVFQPEGDQIVLQASAHEGFKGITLMGADGLLLGSFLDSVGDSGVGMYFVGPAKIDSLEHREFVMKFENKYSQKLTTNFHAQYYDATNLLLAAIETASTEEQDGTLYIGRQALRRALYSTKNFVGLTGRLTCNRFGDCGSARFTVVRIDEVAAGIDGLKSNEIFRYWSGE